MWKETIRFARENPADFIGNVAAVFCIFAMTFAAMHVAGSADRAIIEIKQELAANYGN